MTTNTKPYWAVNKATREVISGPHTAQFRGGIWHIPANTITVEPLPTNAGFAVLALPDGSGTEYIEDNRGKTVYDKQAKQLQEVTELGPLPNSVTELVPEADDIWDTDKWALDPLAIDRHKENKTTEINAWRDQQERKNLQFDHASHNWDGGIDSKSRMDETLALAAALGGLPDGFFWTTANNIDVPMGLTDLQALASALAAARGLRGFEIHARQRQMKAEVDALPSIAVVQEYAVAWPEAVHV